MRSIVSVVCFVLLTSLQRNPLGTVNNVPVVLTYDDALNVHLDYVLKHLTRLNSRHFYLTVAAPVPETGIDDWRKVALNGHELGNHTLFIRALAISPAWLRAPRVCIVSAYSSEANADEPAWRIHFFNLLTEKTNALLLIRVEYDGARYFVCASDSVRLCCRSRCVGNRWWPNTITWFDVNDTVWTIILPKKWLPLLSKAMTEKGLVVFLFHGVGGEHSINVSRKEHNKLLGFEWKKKKRYLGCPDDDVIEKLNK